MNVNNAVKSRIFLSCGQKDEKETSPANKVKDMLEKNGYEVYMAINRHTPENFKKDIFNHLLYSEYYLFIDFKREKLVGSKKKLCRGSLFSHQEFALASYLNLEMLVFQEKGVEEHPGAMQYIMVNPFTFDNRESLPALIEKKINENKDKWKNNWRGDLEVSFCEEAPIVADYSKNKQLGRWMHLLIENKHWFKQAINCKGFITEIKKDNKVIPIELSELKWKGLIAHQVNIPPKKSRKLDAFHIYMDNTCEIVLGVNPYFFDSTAIPEQYTLKGNGVYEVTYMIYSDEFLPVKKKLTLTINECENNFKLAVKDEENEIKYTKEDFEGSAERSALHTTTFSLTTSINFPSCHPEQSPIQAGTITIQPQWNQP